MKRTEVVSLKFCSKLVEGWPGWHAMLVLTGEETINRLV